MSSRVPGVQGNRPRRPCHQEDGVKPLRRRVKNSNNSRADGMFPLRFLLVNLDRTPLLPVERLQRKVDLLLSLPFNNNLNLVIKLQPFDLPLKDNNNPFTITLNPKLPTPGRSARKARGGTIMPLPLLSTLVCPCRVVPSRG